MTLSAHAAPYDYPVANPFMATVTGTPERLRAPVPDEVDVQQTDLQVRVLPERHLPPALSQYRDLHYRVAWHDGPAPLIFLIAGTGSGYDSTRMDYLKRLFWQAGMHVIVLSSPSNHDFIAAASRSGRPGIAEDDARDLHTAMSMALQKAQSELGFKVTGYRLAGFSLGALHAAFVAELDSHLGQFHFERVLLLNPPVDLYASVRRMDELSYTRVAGVSDNDSFYEHIFQKLSRHFANRGNADIQTSLFEEIQNSPEVLNDAELAMLIGAVFRFSAADMNFMSDLINGGGRYAPADEDLKVSTSLTPYLRRALFCDFSCYVDTELLPSWQRRNAGGTLEQMAEQTSLHHIQSFLTDNPNIAAVSNASELILTRDDYYFLADTFGDRAYLYPTGGHGGNLDYEPVAERYLQFLAGDNQ
ncbi:serine/threonine protein kinase [Halopseudomonas oceani]|uniref:serine/threonine protein kinase n=1 Tax=Halopseudomonas oceani TaxID=1708783 RepID=UPI002AA6C0E2|nr:serine/threonine protein kinase [Halopseudomonas oceani]